MIPGLSIVSICLNEQANLPEFLSQVLRHAEQFVLVDTGSSDNSLEILKNHNVTPFHFTWVQDFAKARNFALKQARCPWVLQLDCDDRLPETTWIEIEKLLTGNLADAYCFEYKNTSGRNWQSGAEITSSHEVLRLFRNHPAYEYRFPIHENIRYSIEESGGRILDTGLPIFHLGYVGDLIQEKIERNRDVIDYHWAQGDRTPSLLFYRGLLLMGPGLEAPELFLQCIQTSQGSLRERASGRLLLWCLIYKPRGFGPYTVTDLEVLAEAHPEQRAIVLVSLARRALDEKRAEDALSLYQEARECIAFADRHIFIREILDSCGVIAANLGRLEKAEQYFAEYAVEVGRDGLWLFNQLRLLHMQGDFEKIFHTIALHESVFAQMPLSQRQLFRALLAKNPQRYIAKLHMTAQELISQWCKYWDS